MEQITQFPNLHDTSTIPRRANLHVSFDFRLPTASQDVIIKAWALLLHQYTKHQDSVLFYLDDSILNVDATTLSTEAQSQNNISSGPQGTGLKIASRGLAGTSTNGHSEHIRLEDESLSDLQQQLLLIEYDSASGRSTLHDPGFVPEGFLPQIAEQLQLLVRSTASADDKTSAAQTSNGETVDPSLSILNEHPILSEGPQLLHELIRPSLISKDAGSCVAIEHLNADSRRKSLDYEEFNRKSDLLASRIAELSNTDDSNQTGGVVPLLIPQCPELYVAMLAVLKAGYAYCPLNLDAPLERIRFVVKDVSAKVIVTLRSFQHKFDELEGISLSFVDEDIGEEHADAITTHLRQPSPQDLAYVMYTSGSTGQPKGVGLSHLAVTQSLLAHDTHIPSFSRFLQFAAPTFDVSQFEIFFTFYRNSALISCDRKRLLNDLPSVLTEMEIDGAELTPTVAGSLLISRSNAPKLNVLLTIGEMLTRHVVQEFGGSDEKPSMLQGMYGPTEAAIHCTLQPDFKAHQKVGIVGIPFSTVSAFIAAPDDNDTKSDGLDVLPLGQVGELVVGGYQLADGYLNRPEQTNAAFIDDSNYGRLYRTGDKARILPSGLIECLGRISTGQVKLRGQRIELGEIEQVAMKADECILATASVLQGNLVLFCQGQKDANPASNIKNMCAKWLPPFMIPNDIVVLKDLPRLPSGKVDKKSLESQYLESQSHEDSQEEDGQVDNHFVQELIEIARNVVGIKLQNRSNLSRSGVESLSAIRLASAIRSRGYDVSAIDILNAESTQTLASYLAEKKTTSEGSDSTFDKHVPSIYKAALSTGLLKNTAEEVENVIPCTSLQTSMLAETMLQKTRYCNTIEIEVSERVTSEDFESHIRQIANQNAILRSGFLRQTDSKSPFVRIVWKELAASQIRRVEKLSSNFSIDQDEQYLRPFQVEILPKSPGLSVAFRIHHALYDGWSFDLLLRDLENVIKGKQSQNRPSFEKVNRFYYDLAASDNDGSTKDFWESTLAGMASPAALKSSATEDKVEIVERSTKLSLSEIRRQLGQTFHPQLLFQAALFIIQHQVNMTTDHVFGMVTTGRTIPVVEVEDILGPLIATLPLRLSFESSRTGTSLLLQLQAMNRSLMEHSTLPLQKIKQLAGIDPGVPLFNVLLVWQESLVSNSLNASSIKKVREANSLENPLFLELEPHDDSIMIKASYSSKLVAGSVIEATLNQIEAIALQILENPQRKVGDLNMSSSDILRKSRLFSLEERSKPRYNGYPSSGSRSNGTTAPAKEKDSQPQQQHASDLEYNILSALSEATEVSIFDVDKRAKFFSYGLNSISAIFMSRRIRDLCGATVDISEIFSHPTVQDLATAILEQRDSQDTTVDSLPEIESDAYEAIESFCQTSGKSVVRVRPCTPLQEGMLSAEQMSGANSYFNNTLFDLYGNSSDILEAFQTMTKRHEILRTCFCSSKDPNFGFVQVVLDNASPNIKEVSVDGDDLADTINAEMKANPTAIDNLEPPWRLVILQTDRMKKLLVQLHHALYDGEAVTCLFEEVELSYHHRQLPSAISYDQFLKRSLNSDLDAADKHWSEVLHGYSPTSFPPQTKVSRLGSAPFSSAMTTLSVNLQDVESFCQESSSTMLAVLQSAWAKVLLAFTGESDVCFGNVVSGRTLALDGLERLVAPCFNTIPTRAKVSTKTTNVQLIAQLQELNVRSLPHQFTPLRRIQKKHSVAGSQLFDTLFIQQQPKREFDESIWELVEDVGYMGYPLVCELTPDPAQNSLWLNLHYSTWFLSEHHISLISRAYERALESCLTSTDGKCLNFESRDIRECTGVLYGEIDLGTRTVDTTQLLSSSENAGGPTTDILITRFPGSPSSTQKVYVVVSQQKELDSAKVSELKRFMSEALESAQIEFEVVITREIPYSSRRVPQRKALQKIITPDLNSLKEDDDTDVSSQETDIVRQAFSNFSGVSAEQITKQTIFQLGLDSINAIQIAKYLRDHGYQTNAEDILTNPTVSQLASTLSSTKQTAIDGQARNDIPDISLDLFAYQDVLEKLHVEQRAIDSILPCSPVQAGMISETLRSDGTVYINHMILEIRDKIDVAQLKNAWAQVMRRHEILRTGFASTEDAEIPFVMLCYKTAETKLQFSHLDADSEAISVLQSTRKETASDIFDSLHHPAWRVVVVTESTRAYVQFSGHHALFDAESLNIMFSEVQKIYQGQELPPSPSLQPVLGHILRAAKDEDKSHFGFWNNILDNVSITRFPNLLPLRPSDRQVDKRNLSLSSDMGTLQETCQSLGVTFQALLQSAWTQLLSLYTGETEVVFGIVLSGRDLDESANTNFPCAVTLPCRMSASDDKKQLVSEAMKFGSSARKHQHYPLTRIQRAAGVDNMALFDTLLVLQRSVSGNDDDENAWNVIDEASTVEYSVSLEIRPERNGNVYLQLVFWDDVIPSGQAEILLRQFDSILNQMAFDSSSTKLSKDLLSHLPPKQEILPIDGQLLHENFARSVEKHADAIALEFWPSLDDGAIPHKWTYRQLQEIGHQYAHFLLQNKCPPGSVIATCFEKCPEASFATLGILESGSAFLAVDYSAPVDRKAFILKDSNAAALITSRFIAEDLKKEVNVPVYCIEDIDTSALPASRPSIEVKPESTSYCLYTSGSTGTPKGCIISHKNVVQFIAFFHVVFAGRWNEESRMMQFASYHFDVSVMEQFFSWSIGITLVSTPRDALLEDLAGGLDKLGITHIDLTPSLARLVTPEDVPSLCKGNFITGGEALNQEVLDSWGSKEVIHNGYGPTEATIGCTMYPRVPKNGKPSNIGWQYDNAGIYILHPDTDKIVPRGAIGELCISGELVSQGYINRPDLNEERFPTLFGERIYRTGDLVRMLHDESLDFAGRIDDQVKLRGQRLELGEINATIKESGDVKDATTLVVTSGDSQSKQLISFVALHGSKFSEELHIQDNDQQADAVMESCRARLPVYMVPSRVVVVNKIPLTSNNKVDSKSLKAVFAKLRKVAPSNTNGDDAPGGVDAPKTDIESKVVSVLAKFLSVSQDSLSISISPFQAGVDSISVFPFVKALKSAGFQSARTQIVLQSQTIRDLANALSTQSNTSTDTVAAAKQSIKAVNQRYRGKVAKSLRLKPDQIKHIAPCTPLQQGMIARSFEGQSRQYFNQFVFELDSQVDNKRLRSAWSRVFVHVPILQTYFVPTDEGYVQVHVQAHTPEIPKVSVSGEKLIEELEKRRQDWISLNEEVFLKPFDVFLLEAGSKTLMILHLFHSLYDAISLDLLLSNLANEYGGNKTRYGPSFFEALPFGPLAQHKDATDYWRQNLSGAIFNPVVEITDDTESGTSTATVEDLEWADFEETCRSLNVTHQSVAQACWIAVLQEKLCCPTTIGTIVSGRSLDVTDAENIIGPLFNTVPFSLLFSESDSWQDAISRSHQWNIASLPFQHTPLRDISKAIKRSAREPLFDTLFVLQRQQASTKSGLRLWTELDSPARADYPLSFEMTETSSGSFTLTIVAQSVAVSEDECGKILDRFRAVMNAILSNPSARVADTMGSEFIRNMHSGDYNKPLTQLKKTKSKEGATNSKFASILIQEIAALAGVDSDSMTTETSVFELGLDSIDAIKLCSRLKRKGLQLTVSKILQNPVIADMAQQVVETSSQAGQNDEDTRFDNLKTTLSTSLKEQGFSVEKYEDILPVTPLQEAMVAEMRATEYNNYLNHDVLEISKDADIDKLLAAWDQVVSRNSILRTSFADVETPSLSFSYAQLVHQHSPLECTESDLGPDEDFNIYFEKMRSYFVNSNEAAVPFRLGLVTKGGIKHLVLTMAHALYDGWSQNLLHNDVEQAYRASNTERPPYEPILKNILSSTLTEGENFWHESIADAPGCVFPTRQADSSTNHFKERSSRIHLPEIQAFCKLSNVTLQALGQLTWSAVLASFVGSLDVTFGVVISGRDDEQAQEIMFPTMNTVAIRILLHDSRKEMLQYAQSNLADVMQFQHFPLRKVQQMAGKKLFNTLFIYQKRPAQGINNDSLYKSVAEASDLEYPVCVEMEIVDDQLIWRSMCKDVALSETETEGLIDQLDSVLQAIIQEPQKPMLEFSNAGTSVCELPAFEKQGGAGSETESPAPRGESGSSAPATQVEKEVVAVLSAVSQVPEANIQLDQSIFHLWLDSISAIKVSSLLRKRHYRIPVSAIMRAGTIGGISKVVEANLEGSSGSEDTKGADASKILAEELRGIDTHEILTKHGISHKDVEILLPATAVQILFVTMWQTSSGSIFYPRFQFKLQGSTSNDQIRLAWNKLLEETPILRTVLLSTGSKDEPLVQAVLKRAPESTISFEETAQSREEASPGPLIQLKINSSGDDKLLTFHIHHSLYDAVSHPQFLSRFQSILSGSSALGQTHDASFADFIALSRTSEAKRSQQQFWTSYLHGISPLRLDLDNKVPLERRTTHYTPKALPSIVDLEKKLQRAGMSIQSLFFATVAKSFLARTSSAASDGDVVLGIYLSNRAVSLPGIDTLNAPTLNIVPLRLSSVESTSLLDLAKQAQEGLHQISAEPNAFTPLYKIREWTSVVVDVFVNFLRLPDGESSFSFGSDGDECRISEIPDAHTGTPEVPEVLEFEEPAELKDNPVKGMYPPTVDIEAAVRERDGSRVLDIGVFGPRAIVDEDAAEGWLSGIKSQLNSFSD